MGTSPRNRPLIGLGITAVAPMAPWGQGEPRGRPRHRPHPTFPRPESPVPASGQGTAALTQVALGT